MRRVLLFLGTALLAQTAPQMGVAQAGKAELFVQVHDASGAVVPNARLTLSEETTNQSFLGSTGLSGSFTFSALKPGLYTLKVEAEGFKRFRREHMQLTVGHSRAATSLDWLPFRWVWLCRRVRHFHESTADARV